MSAIGIFNASSADVDAENTRRRRAEKRSPATPVRRETTSPAPFWTPKEGRSVPSAATMSAPRREGSRATSSEAGRKDRSPDEKDDDDHTVYGVPVYACRYERHGEQGRGQDQSLSKESNQVAARMLEGSFDSMALTDSLAPLAGDNGIFEVSLPCGSTLGVVVNKHATGVNFMLSSSNATLARDLRDPQIRMELEGRLERRIGRNVALTVL
jgi:hypothetical protein